jgi:hypothetical protein
MRTYRVSELDEVLELGQLDQLVKELALRRVPHMRRLDRPFLLPRLVNQPLFRGLEDPRLHLAEVDGLLALLRRQEPCATVLLVSKWLPYALLVN